jgi:hypothetical protein
VTAILTAINVPPTRSHPAIESTEEGSKAEAGCEAEATPLAETDFNAVIRSRPRQHVGLFDRLPAEAASHLESGGKELVWNSLLSH